MFYDDLLILLCMTRISVFTTDPTSLFDPIFMFYGTYTITERLFRKRMDNINHFIIVLCMLQLLGVEQKASIVVEMARHIQLLFHVLYMVFHYSLDSSWVRCLEEQFERLASSNDKL